MSEVITDYLNSIEWTTGNTILIVGVALVSLVILNVIYNSIHDIIMMRKLGAYPAHVSGGILGGDNLFGFRLMLKLLKDKKEGRVIHAVHDRLNNIDGETGKIMMATMPIISTRDPENIKAVLATQFNDFALGHRHAHFLPLLGDGIFTLDGQGWKHSRSMLRPQFSREQVGHVRSLEKHVQRLFKQIKVTNNESFDLQKLFFRLTLDSATEFLIGESVESLRDEKIGEPFTKEELIAGREQFAHNFDTSQKWLSIRVMTQRFSWLVNPPEFKHCVKETHKLIDHYVNIALNCSPDELEKHSAEGYTFMYELVKQTRDPKVIRDQVLNILLAGRDTTAGLLSFTFFELSRRPEIFKKLQDEIEQTFGTGEDSRLEDITFESMKRCEYLKSVLNELLRMYPSVPVNFRVATKDTTLPRGGGKDGLSPLYVRKGTNVNYAVSSMHRTEAHYGPDANVYKPERWFEPESRNLGWAYLPFNGGPRICLGQQFALTEASYVIIRLLQTFNHLKTTDPNSNTIYPLVNSNLTMSLKDGCLVEMS